MKARFILFSGLLIIIGCTRGKNQQQKPDDNDKNGIVSQVNAPFMEHPSGKFETAVDAMADAIERLRKLPEWKDWIAFNAQGMGGRVDSYRFAEIRVLQNEIKLDKQLDLDLVTQRASVPRSSLSKTGEVYSISNSTPIQMARILDVIFRHDFGIRPHDGEGNDYSVGAEWVRP